MRIILNLMPEEASQLADVLDRVWEGAVLLGHRARPGRHEHSTLVNRSIEYVAGVLRHSLALQGVNTRRTAERGRVCAICGGDTGSIIRYHKSGALTSSKSRRANAGTLLDMHPTCRARSPRLDVMTTPEEL